MASKVFLDANILLDLTLGRPGVETAKKIIKAGIEGKLRLFTSPSIIHIISFYTTKSFNINLTRRIILTLMNDVQVIDADHQTVQTALSNTSWSDLEDSIQYHTAMSHKIDFFLSGDKKLKKEALPQLPILTPEDLVKRLKL